MHVVFGGSFNPPTKAHLDAYHRIKRLLDLDTFIFLPVGEAYGKDITVSDVHRRAMLERLVEPFSDAVVSYIEMEAETYEGTYRSLKRLASEYGDGMAFVAGADHLRGLPRWRHAERLLDEFKIVVLNRGRVDLEWMIARDPWLRARRNAFILCPDYDYDESSSEFRATRDFALLPERIGEYVKCHGLYEGVNACTIKVL